ncbi:MAG: hypothetical protein ACOVNU_08025 [Candidatus Kapaibacteriota bacterium]
MNQTKTTQSNKYILSIETNAPIFRYIDNTAIRITREDLISLYINFREYHVTLISFAKSNTIAIEEAQQIVAAGNYFHRIKQSFL